MGERVYDVMRGLDYLALRGDATWRGGLMGNSNGGMVTLCRGAPARAGA